LARAPTISSSAAAAAASAWVAGRSKVRDHAIVPSPVSISWNRIVVPLSP
jgi:hypothetical protein